MTTFSIETPRTVDAPFAVVLSVVSDAGGYHAIVTPSCGTHRRLSVLTLIELHPYSA